MVKSEDSDMVIRLFAERLNSAMEERGMRAADLAKASGVSKSMISMYQSGHHEPKQLNILRLARALHVSPAWLMGAQNHDGTVEQLNVDPNIKTVIVIGDNLTDDGKRELRRYAELLKLEKDRKGNP